MLDHVLCWRQARNLCNKRIHKPIAHRSLLCNSLDPRLLPCGLRDGTSNNAYPWATAIEGDVCSLQQRCPQLFEVFVEDVAPSNARGATRLWPPFRALLEVVDSMSRMVGGTPQSMTQPVESGGDHGQYSVVAVYFLCGIKLRYFFFNSNHRVLVIFRLWFRKVIPASLYLLHSRTSPLRQATVLGRCYVNGEVAVLLRLISLFFSHGKSFGIERRWTNVDHWSDRDTSNTKCSRKLLVIYTCTC